MEIFALPLISRSGGAVDLWKCRRIRHITLEIMENSLQRSYITMDKDGDGHYDVLSALQKSIRGSDVDASLHYAARFDRSRDLPSLARRLTVIAYEDIGLANRCADSHTVTALQAAGAHRLSWRPAFIANIVIDLALSPKSNSAYVAMDKALADLRSSGNLPMPRHLRDGHYAGNARNWKCANYKYPPQLPWQLGHSGLLARTSSNTLPTLFPMRKYEYGRALRPKEKIDQFKKKWHRFLKKLEIFPWNIFKMWYHIRIETLWCTTSHEGVDRLFLLLWNKRLLAVCRPLSRGSS